jgi:hypothetical protein
VCLAVLFSNPHLLQRLWNSRSHPTISMIYAPRFQRPFEKMAAWGQEHECFKRAWHPLRWQIPLRNTRCEEFPAHRRHTVEVERKDTADVLPQGTEQGNSQN